MIFETSRQSTSGHSFSVGEARVFSPRDTLFIDIDDTLVRQRSDVNDLPKFLGQSLLWLMREAATEQGMNRGCATDIIQKVHHDLRWWGWSDFLDALHLDRSDFWDYAYREQKASFEPVDSAQISTITALARAGYRMVITSNNPKSGILHKLRLVGLAESRGSPYFLDYLSPTDLHHMKKKPDFWRRCLLHMGLRASEVVTIGDLWPDDVMAPRAVGIGRCIHLDPKARKPVKSDRGVWSLPSWDSIGALLLDGRYV